MKFIVWLKNNNKVAATLFVAPMILIAFGQNFSVAVTVPAEYQELYNSLNSKMSDFNTTLGAKWTGKYSGLKFGAELLTANSHGGNAILTDDGKLLTRKTLDRFQAIGVDAVTVHIAFPVFYRPFHDLPEVDSYDAYLNYYKWLVSEIRTRGLKFVVDSGPTFPPLEGCAYSGLPVTQEYYRQFTVSQYIQGRINTVAIIAKELKPDHISIGAEFDVEQMLTGQPMSGANLGFYINTSYQYVKGISPNTTVGIGVGTWNDHYRDIMNAYLNPALSSDVIDVHIYPINFDYLDRALTIAQMAKSGGKKVFIGETWLNKVSDADANNPATSPMFALGTFGFWQPLDQAFLGTLMKLSHVGKIDYIAPFWTNFFSTYLDYEQYKIVGACERLDAAQLEAQAALRNDAPMTPVAETFRQWINWSKAP